MTVTPTVHFVISLTLAFSLEYRHQRKYIAILLLGFIGLLPDLDHLLAPSGMAGCFHNTLVLGALPLVLFILSHLIETSKGGKSSAYQRFFICVTVIFLAHICLDLIAHSSLRWSPMSPPIHIQTGIVLVGSAYGTLLTSADSIWLVIIAMALIGNATQVWIYNLYEGFEKAIRKSLLRPISREDAAWAIISQPIRTSKDMPSLPA